MLQKINDICTLFSAYPDVQEMFKESEKCFKVEAYRAALLFAFSAFLKVLSRKIIEYGKPDSVTEGEWNDTCAKLTSDDSLEEHVLKCIQSRDNKYFLINQSLKDQITSWKNLRNACAHWKDELIDEYTVENFYSFILFNQYKFSLKTSAENAVKELLSFLDSNVYQSDTTLEKKVKSLPYLLADNDIDNFCNLLMGSYYYRITDNIVEIINSIMIFSPEKYKESFIKYFHTNIRQASELIEKNNHLLTLIFSGDRDFESLLKSDDCYYKNRQMIASLLKKKGLLTNSLLQIFFNTLYNEDECAIHADYSDLIPDCSFLFLEKVRKGNLVYTDYGTINSKSDLIYQLLSCRTIDSEIIDIWNKFFEGANYSWHLEERFGYKEDKRKKYNKDILDFANANNITLNTRLTNILNNNL